jgi:hypothetical protein
LSAILVLLISGEPITTPFGTYSRRLRDAGEVLKEATPEELDRITKAAFMDVFSQPPPPPPPS